MTLAEYRTEAVLRDGTPAVIRAIRGADKDALQRGFEQLSPETVYHRFFQTKRELTEADLRYLTEVDFVNHVALIAEVEIAGEWRMIGVARFVRDPVSGHSDQAEVAFTVGDAYQGRGIATLLLDRLAVMARQLGYRRFVAEVLPENRPMLEVFEHSDLPMRAVTRERVVYVEMDLDTMEPK